MIPVAGLPYLEIRGGEGARPDWATDHEFQRRCSRGGRGEHGERLLHEGVVAAGPAGSAAVICQALIPRTPLASLPLHPPQAFSKVTGVPSAGT